MGQPKIKIFIIALMISFACFEQASALEMPQGFVAPEQALSGSPESYVVMDVSSRQIVAEKNSASLWVPASLTKLVTALVVLDTDPKLTKIVSMAKSDEVGGARLATKAGVKYTLDGLFNAALIASANNAANALARSTGLTREVFVRKMNEKAASLGATNTVFFEPTGMDPRNVTTAEDYLKISEAAFGIPYIQKISSKPTYLLRSTNYKSYAHNLKNTNKLLGSETLDVLAGKTGYLEESKYNFAAKVKDRIGNTFLVVVMGCGTYSDAFAQTKLLTAQAGLKLAFEGLRGAVLGTSTSISNFANNF